MSCKLLKGYFIVNFLESFQLENRQIIIFCRLTEGMFSKLILAPVIFERLTVSIIKEIRLLSNFPVHWLGLSVKHMILEHGLLKITLLLVNAFLVAELLLIINELSLLLFFPSCVPSLISLCVIIFFLKPIYSFSRFFIQRRTCIILMGSSLKVDVEVLFILLSRVWQKDFRSLIKLFFLSNLGLLYFGRGLDLFLLFYSFLDLRLLLIFFNFPSQPSTANIFSVDERMHLALSFI